MRLLARMKPVGWFWLRKGERDQGNEESQDLSLREGGGRGEAEASRPTQGQPRTPTSADTAASCLPPHAQPKPGTQLCPCSPDPPIPQPEGPAQGGLPGQLIH